jgi:hypothetical protein
VEGEEQGTDATDLRLDRWFLLASIAVGAYLVLAVVYVGRQCDRELAAALRL